MSCKRLSFLREVLQLDDSAVAAQIMLRLKPPAAPTGSNSIYSITCGINLQPLELFRRKAGIVRVLCRVSLAFSMASHSGGGGGAAAAQQLREGQPTVAKFYSDAESGYLEFDPGDFRFNSDEEYRWPASAKGAVLKMPRYRAPKESASILALMRQLRFCRRLAPEVQKKMAEQAYYMRLEKGRDVLRSGHTGYSFYMIFSGQVRIISSSATNSESILLKKGDAFGERALLFETTRNATVTTEKLTEFLIIYDDCFADSGLADYFTQQYRRIEHFLRCLPLFSSLPTGTLASLSRHCALLEHLDGSLIVRDSLSSPFVWFVMSGSVDLFGQVAPAERNSEAEEQQRRRLNWLASIDAGIPEFLPRPRTAGAHSRARFVMPGQLPNRYMVKVGHLTAGKSFGLSSIFNQSRSFSLMSRGCEMIALSSQLLLDHVSRSQLESAQLLYESVPSDKRMQRRCELQCDWMLYRRREMRATVNRLQAISDRFEKIHAPPAQLPPAGRSRARKLKLPQQQLPPTTLAEAHRCQSTREAARQQQPQQSPMQPQPQTDIAGNEAAATVAGTGRPRTRSSTGGRVPRASGSLSAKPRFSWDRKPKD